MKIASWRAGWALAAILCSTPLTQAHAAQVTLSGASFELSFDDTLLGLFGSPTLLGDTLSWFPSGSPGFSAQAVSGIDFTNSTFAVRVAAKPGYQLSSFSLREAGDYVHFGSGAGVAVSGQLRVTPLPGITLVDGIDAVGLEVANGPYDFRTRSWQAMASIDVIGEVTLANVSVQNLLAAFAPAAGGFAFIEKKEVMLDIVTSPVPEPGTLGLMLAGMAALAAARRRPG